jgi:hypothetical protein
MAQENFNVSQPNDGLGDKLRSAFIKVQSNFTELFTEKVDKEVGKGLSANDYTTTEKNKLANIEDFAELNVQSDFLQNDDTQDDFIKNKPAIPVLDDYVLNGGYAGTAQDLDDAIEAGGQLVKVTENGQTGYRLKDSNPANYGNIGFNAVDLSFSQDASTTRGAIGDYSHASGLSTGASGFASHAEGNGTTAIATSSHAEGNGTTAIGASSHAEGNDTDAIGAASHAEGESTTASGAASHAEGNGTTAIGAASHAEGNGTTASGAESHAEGNDTTASGAASHAEGSTTTASGNYSHAEGELTTASGNNSHAEGNGTNASGNNSHTEGNNTTASGFASHAEGDLTTASGNLSHAEGFATTASGFASHAEGNGTTAIGDSSHASGSQTFARSFGEHSGGVNGTDYTPQSATEFDPTDRLVNYGNGVDTSNRSDAYTLFKNGMQKFFTAALNTITNAVKGSVMLDENARLNIHDGTAFKAVAFSSEVATAAQGVTADNSVQLTGSQTVAGVKTFSDNIISSGTVTASNGTLLAGTGTTNRLAKFTASGAVGNSAITELSFGNIEFDGNINTKGGAGKTLSIFDNNSSRNNRIVLGANDNGSFINGVFSSGGTRNIILNQIAGNVGIGNATPTEVLDVVGNGKFSGTVSCGQFTTATEPAYVKGAQFFNTTLNKMRIGGATAYETVTSS